MENSDTKKLNFLFWVTAILHVVVDGFIFNFNREEMFYTMFWIYAFLAIAASFLFFKSDRMGDRFKLLLVFFMLSAIAIYLPYLKDRLVDLINPANSIMIFINGVLLFTGIWPLYLWKNGLLSGKTESFANKYVAGWLILIITILLFNTYETATLKPDENVRPMDVGEVIGKLTEVTSKMVVGLFKGVANVPSQASKALNDSYSKSTGQQYYGEVERNAKDEKVGVFIEDVKEANPENRQSEDIVLWATIKAKVYDGSAAENNMIEIVPSCVADRHEAGKNKTGKIRPAGPFRIFSYDEQDVDCTFEAESDGKGKRVSLTPGGHTITFSAKFNFVTKAYRKAYFADYDLLRSLNKENIDIFTQYNLERNPKGIYTNGPVEIGIETQDIMGVKDDDEARRPSIGFSLKNKVLGELKKINEIKLFVPEGLKVDYCTPFNFEEQGTFDGHTIYSLKDKGYENNRNAELQSFRCVFKVTGKDTLMDKGPISTRYFKVEARYDYVLHRSKEITVKYTT